VNAHVGSWIANSVLGVGANSDMQNPEHLRPADPDQPVVLLAEDDVMILNIARITLERDGYFLLTAENGEEALYLSRRFPGEIHLLLTDVTMPKIGGMELSKRVSTERPTTRILMMSGATSSADLDPKYPFLPKPFNPAKLSDWVRGLLPVRHPKIE